MVLRYATTPRAFVDASENTHSSVCTALESDIAVYARGMCSLLKSCGDSLQASNCFNFCSGRGASQLHVSTLISHKSLLPSMVTDAMPKGSKMLFTRQNSPASEGFSLLWDCECESVCHCLPQQSQTVLHWCRPALSSGANACRTTSLFEANLCSLRLDSLRGLRSLQEAEGFCLSGHTDEPIVYIEVTLDRLDCVLPMFVCALVDGSP